MLVGDYRGLFEVIARSSQDLSIGVSRHMLITTL
jgi:hypothetical protein